MMSFLSTFVMNSYVYAEICKQNQRFKKNFATDFEALWKGGPRFKEAWHLVLTLVVKLGTTS